MANTIKLKRKTDADGAPTTGDLVEGELAINAFSGRLFLEKSDGGAAIVELIHDQGGQTIGGDLTITGTADASVEYLFTERAAHNFTPAATRGILWVRNDAPNVLVFTDDDGTDWDLNLAVGDVTAGTQADTQVAYWNATAKQIEGSAAFTWVESGFDQTLTVGDGTQRNPTININSQNDANGNGKIVFQEAGSGRAQIDFSPVTDTLDIGVIVTGSDTTSILRLLANNQAKQVINREGTTFETAMRFRESSLDPFDDEAAFGQLWVRDDAPNVLVFTDDDGTDWDLNTAGGSGNVSNTGTPVNNQLAIWTDATTIEGVTAITYDGTDFLTTADFTVESAAPRIQIHETDATSGKRNYAWIASGDTFGLQLGDDTWASAGNVITMTRTANTLDQVAINADEVFLNRTGGTITFQEGASSSLSGTTSGKGKLWVRTEIPNILVFTDDAGTDWDLNVAATSPGGSDTQVQYNNGGSAFGGMAEFTYDDTAPTTGNLMSMVPNAALTSGNILNITSNISTKTGYLMSLINDHASSIAGGLSMRLDGGSGVGLAIDSDSSGRNLDISGTGGGDGLYVRLTNVAGEHIHLHNDVANRTEDAMLRVEQFNTTDPNAVKIVHITTRGVGDALYVGSIEKVDNQAAHFYSSTASRTVPVALIHNDSATGSGTALEIRQDQLGAALVIADDTTVGQYNIGKVGFSIPAVTQDNWVTLGRLHSGSYTVKIATEGSSLYNSATFTVNVEWDSAATGDGSHDETFITCLETSVGFTELEEIYAEWIAVDEIDLWLQIQGTVSGGGEYTVSIEGVSEAGIPFVGDGTVTQTDPTLTNIIPSMTIDDAVVALSGDLDPTVTNTQDIGASGLVWANVWATTFNGTATTAQYADLAEKYLADADYEVGTVVSFGGDKEITQSDEYLDHRIAGIVSADPAFLMNVDLPEGTTVALRGRIPCKVFGDIKKGDLLVSTGDGTACAVEPLEARAGTILGKALENFTGEYGVIEVVV